MDFLHERQYLEEGDIVVVDCDHQCNIMVMNDHNFQSYRSGRRWDGYGGFYKNADRAGQRGSLQGPLSQSLLLGLRLLRAWDRR